MIVEILLWSVAIILVAAGLLGLVLPAVPGSPLIFLGLVSASWAEGFSHAGARTLTLLGVIAILIYAVDFAAGALGARRFGASRRSVIGAAVGAVVGLFFGVAGVFLGPFAGAVIGELTVRPDILAAGRAGLGATIGLILGTAAKLSLGFSMLAVYIFVRFVT
ncbi:MAG: DUF456 domain-containing protein [Thermodesulfobacteriota bacterium]